MGRLRPFFWYYGGKWKLAPKYPAPKYPLIIEPFAGSAGYSTTYFNRDILLNDASTYVFHVWKYLSRATRQDILSLPLLTPKDCIDGFGLPIGASYLIGFWCYAGLSTPATKMVKCEGIRWTGKAFNNTNSFWGEKVRDRIAYQLDALQSWRVTNMDYRSLPNVEATWFIDPPYQFDKGGYPVSQALNYDELREFCLSRKGQVIVCEMDPAKWLNFDVFHITRSSKVRVKKIKELIWYQET